MDVKLMESHSYREVFMLRYVFILIIYLLDYLTGRLFYIYGYLIGKMLSRTNRSCLGEIGYLR